MRSCATPPKTMAPKRPFPMGSDSSHFEAGCRYHSANESAGGSAAHAFAVIQVATMSMKIIPLSMFTPLAECP
jgi:hypothetical protein